MTAPLGGCASVRTRLRETRLEAPERRVPADWRPSPGEWPMDDYGYGRTKHNPYAVPPRDEPTAAWTHADLAGRITSLVVADGTVFVRTETELVALDAADGDERWRRTRGDRGSLAAIAGRLYEADDETLRALAFDGTESWDTAGGDFYHVFERDGWVYLPARDRVTRVHADTGDVVDELEVDAFGPATAGGSLYGGRFSVSAFDVNGSTFDARWSVEPEGPYDGYDPAVVADGRLYRTERAFAGTDAAIGRLSIYETTDGATAAAVSFDHTVRAPAVADGSIYASTSAMTAGELGEAGRFVALSHDGSECWRYEPDAGLRPPVVANRTVYVGPFANRTVPLVAFDAVTGETLWRRDVGETPALAVADETLYVGADRRVRALRSTA